MESDVKKTGMLVSGQCLGCARLVSPTNVSRVTAKVGAPIYCNQCEDLAMAHLMSQRMDRALSGLFGKDVSGPADQALQLLIRRLRGSFETLRVLFKAGLFTPHHHDPATILRAMYDAALQAEYIAEDPENANMLAQTYLDFLEIERHRLIRSLGKYKDDFAGKMITGEQRAANEVKIKERFEKVEGKFRKGNGYMTSWHDEHLRDFSKMKGRKEEYDFVHVLLHGAAHSTALAMVRGYSANPSFLMLSAANLTWRAIGGILDFHKLEMDEEIAAIITNARRSLLDINKDGEPVTAGAGAGIATAEAAGKPEPAATDKMGG